MDTTIRQRTVKDCVIGLILFLLSCAHVTTVQVIDINLSPPLQPQTKVCYGTNNVFSISGNEQLHYARMRRRYTGCTHVDGNLEITHLNGDSNDYDLSFLSDIRVVRGYVLIGLTELPNVVLPNLVLIKAEQTVKFRQGRYGLLVAANHDLESVEMPALKEISNGDVLYTLNPVMCYADTIVWDVLTSGHVIIMESTESYNCTDCSVDCADATGERHCWGSGTDNCQEVERRECDWICPGRCHSEGLLGCCHPECAAGCTGSLPTECTECRNFRHRGRCVSSCPPGSYRTGVECEDY